MPTAGELFSDFFWLLFQNLRRIWHIAHHPEFPHTPHHTLPPSISSDLIDVLCAVIVPVLFFVAVLLCLVQVFGVVEFVWLGGAPGFRLLAFG